MKWVYDKIFGDKIIWGITIFLSLISVLLIYVATDDLAYAFKDGNTFYFATKHAIILALGLLLIYYVHLIPPHLFSKLGILLLSFKKLLVFSSLIHFSFLLASL